MSCMCVISQYISLHLYIIFIIILQNNLIFLEEIPSFIVAVMHASFVSYLMFLALCFKRHMSLPDTEICQTTTFQQGLQSERMQKMK